MSEKPVFTLYLMPDDVKSNFLSYEVYNYHFSIQYVSLPIRNICTGK